MRRGSPFVRTPERDRHCSRKSPLSRKVLTVTRGDRLARSTGDLQDIVRELKAKGAHLRATEVLPRYAGSLRRIPNEPWERTADGRSRQSQIESRLQRTQGFHRRSRIEAPCHGLTPTQIAAPLKIARQSVYRVLKGAVA